MKFTVFFLFAILSANIIPAQPISQFRGINRDAHYADEQLLKSWPDEGPTLKWKVESLVEGYSAATVYDNTIYITGKIDSLDYITALTTDSKEIWQISFGKAWDQSFTSSRCTPTVENDRIYLTSGIGEMVCLDRLSGNILWSVNYNEKFQGTQLPWGMAESPLIVNNIVVATPGGNETSMIAFDKRTGEIVWQTESFQEKTAYVSPLYIHDENYNIIVGVISTDIFGVNPANGKILWKNKYSDILTPLDHPNSPFINCNTPLYDDGKIYITSGYNHVGVQYELAQDGNSVKTVWTDSTLDCHVGGVVLVDGYIYGSNWLNNGMGNWCCIEWQSGKTMYETGWNNKGSIIYADGMLYCYDKKRGNVALVKANPTKFEVVSSFRIRDGKGPHWARPVIDDDILYIRHGDVLHAFDIHR